MAKKIIVEESFKTDDNTIKNQIIRQNLIRQIISMQEKEWELRADADSSQEKIT